MRMRRLLPRSRRSGVAALEFALVAPLLVTLLLGVWELGQAIRMYQLIANAAREGVRQAASAKYTNAEVKQAVFDYLLRANVPLSDTLPNSSVTLSNTNAVITVSAANASNTTYDADQFVPMTVNVRVPIRNFRWLVSNVFLSASDIEVTAGGLCLKDIPITVDSQIPQAPLQ